MKTIPIGYSDFKYLREQDFYYIDKSLLIKEIIEDGSQVLLVPRPRRFGKTLNLSMLRYFFEKVEDVAHIKELFAGLAIENEDVFDQH
jgi:hypothetical protein